MRHWARGGWRLRIAGEQVVTRVRSGGACIAARTWRGAACACHSTAAMRRRMSVGREQHCHSHKAQPKAGLQKRPGVIDHDQQQSQNPDVWPRPAGTCQAQKRHPGQHDASALRRYAPTGKHRIRAGHQQATGPSRRGRGPPQTQALRTPPQPTDQPARSPSKHGDVQTRNTDQVRHPGSPKKRPLLLVQRGLVAHYQRGYQRRLARLGHCRKNALAQALAPALHRVSQRDLQALRRRITRAGAHIAGGLHPLLPEPQFIVKALKIEAAVRGFDAHRHTPALARHHGLGLPMQLPIAQVCRRAARCHAPVPA